MTLIGLTNLILFGYIFKMHFTNNRIFIQQL